VNRRQVEQVSITDQFRAPRRDPKLAMLDV
jgi:hypothetical protein